MAQHFTPPPYPQILTDKDWQKHKGLIAKLAGKSTGVGDAMKKAEAAYTAVKWQSIDLLLIAPQGNQKTKAAVQKAFDTLSNSYRAPVASLEKALLLVQSQAAETVSTWKKNKAIPGDSLKHAEAVATAAMNFHTSLNVSKVAEFVAKQRDTLLADVEKMNALLAQGIKTLVTYMKGFPAAAKVATVPTYNKLWAEHIRGVGTQLAPLAKSHPEFQAEYDAWKKYSNKEVTPKSDEELKKQIDALTQVLHTLPTKLAQLGH